MGQRHHGFLRVVIPDLPQMEKIAEGAKEKEAHLRDLVVILN